VQYLLHIIILVGLYAILASSLNLIAGYAGTPSIAHAAFYGVGAYVVALMSLEWNSPFLLNLLCAMALSGVLGGIVGIPSLRIRGDYFVITTFAFEIIAFSLFNNWISVTNGPMGLPGIPPPRVLGWTVDSPWEFLLLTGALLTVVLWACHRIVCSAFGRVLMAIREDESFALSMGKNVAVYKVLVFVIGATMASVAGAVYAHYITFIDPTSFTVMESIFIISIVIIGGAGSLWGPVVGAVALVTLPEILRFIGLPSSVAANVRQILYGGLLVVFMMLRPQGLMGNHAFDKGGAAR
jgi:branched-chain amino acid transport system permease protein